MLQFHAMKLQNGLTPLVVLLIAAVVITTAIGGLSAYSKIKESKDIENKPEEIPDFYIEEFPTSTPTPSLKPTLKPLPTRIPLSPTLLTAKINVQISDNGTPISDSSIYFFLRNESSAQEQIIKNANSGYWTLSGLKPAKYKMYVSYSYNDYMNIEKNCDGCQNKEEISNPGSCGYTVDLSAGDNIQLFCTLRRVKPLSSQPVDFQPSDDSTPPNTNIYYPQPNGPITYKIDGQVCAIANPPNDNSGPEGIETEYRFDNENWSGFTVGRGYLCTPSLSNGPHTLSYRSKDRVGNVESTKTLQFTVNIPGN